MKFMHKNEPCQEKNALSLNFFLILFSPIFSNDYTIENAR